MLRQPVLSLAVSLLLCGGLPPFTLVVVSYLPLVPWWRFPIVASLALPPGGLMVGLAI